MKEVEKKYRSLPFWSWNDELDPEKLVKQIEWMNEKGIGGFFMHARGGLKTEYLGEKWFECIEACAKKAQELGMEAFFGMQSDLQEFIQGGHAAFMPSAWQYTCYINLCLRLAMTYGTYQFTDSVNDFVVCVFI